MEKVLVSACLLGLAVRYDGASKGLIDQTLRRWQQQGRIISVCPEVAGGLSIPRAAAEIQPLSGTNDTTNNTIHNTVDKDKRIVTTALGNDVSEEFYRGAHHALYLCQRHNIRYALLKESSPSCGSNNIYNGDFNGTKISGEGITCELLRKHGIEVYSEFNLTELISKLTQPKVNEQR